MLKTKKDILAWYFKRGEIVDDGKGEVNRDHASLIGAFDDRLSVEKINQDEGYFELVINKSSWKFPIRLFFTPQGENYSIRGY